MLPLSWCQQLLAWVDCRRWICGILSIKALVSCRSAAAAALLVLALPVLAAPVVGAVSRAARLALVSGFGMFAVGRQLEMVGILARAAYMAWPYVRQLSACSSPNRKHWPQALRRLRMNLYGQTTTNDGQESGG